MGYGIGVLAYENQQGKSRTPMVSLTDGSVTAHWRF